MRKTFISFFLLLLFGCNKITKTHNEIVLIIHNAEVFNDFDRAMVLYSKTEDKFVTYLDDELQTRFLCAKPGVDTLIIPTRRDYVEFSQFYKINGRRYYLLQKGDTVDVRFNEQSEPVFESRIEKRRNYGYNFVMQTPSPRLIMNFLPYTIQNSQPFTTLIKWKKNQPENYELWAEKFDKYYVSEKIMNGAIDVFDKNYLFRLKNDSLSMEQRKYFEYYLSLVKNFKKPGYASLNDEYIGYISYQDFLDNILYSWYLKLKNIPSTSMVNGVYSDKNGHKSSTMAIDSLIIDTKIPIETKYYLISKGLRKMYLHKDPNYDIYSQKYLDLGGLISYLSFDMSTFADYAGYSSLKLENAKGRGLTFQDVLDKNKGKVIYLDFWSTSCGPCIETMPAAAKLRKSFAGKDVVFIFIALWDKKDTWDKGWKKIIGSDSDYHSYFSTNSKESKMLTDFGIQTIPHYMLFNKEGKLVDDNTIYPHNPYITDLITKHL